MATLADDPLALTMRAVGIEVTRDGYIRAAYGDNDIPKSWTPEHEMELPEELQDWTLFPPELRPLEPPDDAEAEEAQSGSAPTESGAPTPSENTPELLRGMKLPPNFKVVSAEEARTIAIIGARPPKPAEEIELPKSGLIEVDAVQAISRILACDLLGGLRRVSREFTQKSAILPAAQD